MILRPDGSMAFEPITGMAGDNAEQTLAAFATTLQPIAPSKWEDVEA